MMNIFFSLLLLALDIAPSTAVAGNGATVTVDGIKSRPEYAYAAPQEFFFLSDSDTGLSGKGVYQAEDFGAVADPTVDNRAAIQDAIDAAHAAGGGMVVLQSGTYGISKRSNYHGALLMKDNVFLKGMGMGETVLRVVDGWDYDLDDGYRLTGIIRSPHGEATKNYGIADLTLDGNRENTNGLIDGFYSGGIPGYPISDADVWVIRVEARNCPGFGFEQNERHERLTITNSISHHNTRDGFISAYITDSVYTNNTAYENERHGFNIVRATNDLLLSDNFAVDNGGSGIVIQRGGYNMSSLYNITNDTLQSDIFAEFDTDVQPGSEEDIPLPNNIMVTGGETSRNMKEGMLLLMCNNVEVNGVDVLENGSYGVRIHGSSHVSVLNNQIINNSRSKDGGYAGIQVNNYLDVKNTNRTYVAENNTISGNAIGWTNGLSGKTDVQILVENKNNDVTNNITVEGEGWTVDGDVAVLNDRSNVDFIIGGVSIAAVLVAVLVLVWWWRKEKKG